MSTLLEIALCTHARLEKKFNFFSSDEWTQDTEQALFHRLHELVCLLRPHASSLSLQCQAAVTDPENILILLKKAIYYPPEITTQKLSKRETEILQLIMQGLTNPEIADRLFISSETVKSHRHHILTKTGARNTAALITYYHQTFFEKE